MRLFPPAPTLMRLALKPDVIGGQAIEAGTAVIISPWILHRHETLWDEPDAFRPERFLPENRKAIDRYAYIPFSAGPRVCIGAAFALQEAMIALATILRAAEVEAITPVEPRPTHQITLRSRRPMRLRLRARKTLAVARPPPDRAGFDQLEARRLLNEVTEPVVVAGAIDDHDAVAGPGDDGQLGEDAGVALVPAGVQGGAGLGSAVADRHQAVVERRMAGRGVHRMAGAVHVGQDGADAVGMLTLLQRGDGLRDGGVEAIKGRHLIMGLQPVHDGAEGEVVLRLRLLVDGVDAGQALTRRQPIADLHPFVGVRGQHGGVKAGIDLIQQGVGIGGHALDRDDGGIEPCQTLGHRRQLGLFFGRGDRRDPGVVQVQTRIVEVIAADDHHPNGFRRGVRLRQGRRGGQRQAEARKAATVFFNMELLLVSRKEARRVRCGCVRRD